MKKRHNIGESGFTLIELLVVLLILSVILISVPVAFKGNAQVWQKGDKHSEVLQNSLIGMEEITRKLKQAQYLTNPSADYIEFIDKNGAEMKFDQDVDGYLQYGPLATLERLAGPLNSLSFTYYEGDGVTTTTEPDKIRSVVVKMNTVDDEGGNNIFLSSRIYIRDLIVSIYGNTPMMPDDGKKDKKGKKGEEDERILGPGEGECDGKCTQLTFKYSGAAGEIEVVQKKDGVVAFSGLVDTDEVFTVNGQDANGTLGTEIEIYVDGVLAAYLHTSCSREIGPGSIAGDFLILEGYSLDGGLLPPVLDPFNAILSKEDMKAMKDEGVGSAWPGEFAIVGHGGIYLDDKVEVDGSIGSNGNIDLSKDVNIKNDVVHLGILYQEDPGQISFGSDEQLNLQYIEMPCATDFSGFTPGDDVTKKATLDPDEYGDLNLKKDDVLKLRSGVYYFTSFTVGDKVTMEIDLKEDPGEIRIFVRGQINIGSGFKIKKKKDGRVEDIYIETNYGFFDDETESAVIAGKGSDFSGTIYAPYGDIGLLEDTIVEGSLYSGGQVYLSKKAKVEYVYSNALWDKTRCPE